MPGLMHKFVESKAEKQTKGQTKNGKRKTKGRGKNNKRKTKDEKTKQKNTLSENSQWTKGKFCEATYSKLRLS